MTPTLEEQLTVAKALYGDTHDRIHTRKGLGRFYKEKVWLNTCDVFNPFSPDTAIALMERFKMETHRVWHKNIEEWQAVRELYHAEADTIPEAVFYCALKILGKT